MKELNSRASKLVKMNYGKHLKPKKQIWLTLETVSPQAKWTLMMTTSRFRLSGKTEVLQAVKTIQELRKCLLNSSTGLKKSLVRSKWLKVMLLPIRDNQRSGRFLMMLLSIEIKSKSSRLPLIHQCQSSLSNGKKSIIIKRFKLHSITLTLPSGEMMPEPLTQQISIHNFSDMIKSKRESCSWRDTRSQRSSLNEIDENQLQNIIFKNYLT